MYLQKIVGKSESHKRAWDQHNHGFTDGSPLNRSVDRTP